MATPQSAQPLLAPQKRCTSGKLIKILDAAADAQTVLVTMPADAVHCSWCDARRRNGCFWGRQKDFVDVEKSLGRSGEKVSAVVGYAGGRKTGEPQRIFSCLLWMGWCTMLSRVAKYKSALHDRR